MYRTEYELFRENKMKAALELGSNIPPCGQLMIKNLNFWNFLFLFED